MAYFSFFVQLLMHNHVHIQLLIDNHIPKQPVYSEHPDQMQHNVASDLDLHYLPMSQKYDVRLI